MNTESTIFDILTKESTLMDTILELQKHVHTAVIERNWMELEKNMSKMQDCTVDFITLDTKRDSMMNGNLSIEEHNLMKTVQAKLIRSKIENSALNDYVKISNGFVQNVIENVVPQRRNVVYSRNGSLVKKQPQSIVLNRVF